VGTRECFGNISAQAVSAVRTKIHQDDVLIAPSVSEQKACLWPLDKDFEPLFKAKFLKALRSAREFTIKAFPARYS
jgi:hypothetical protein